MEGDPGFAFPSASELGGPYARLLEANIWLVRDVAAAAAVSVMQEGLTLVHFSGQPQSFFGYFTGIGLLTLT